VEVAIGLIVLALIVISFGPSLATYLGRMLLMALRAMRRSGQSIRRLGIRSEE
jgi:MMPL family